MVAFTAYAILVGFFAARWRRRVGGFLFVIAAEGLLILLAWLHFQIPALAAHGHAFFQDIDIQPFQLIYYPYVVFVGLLGTFIVSLPRRAPVDSCWFCRYDLSNLIDEPGRLICPECGREHMRPGSSLYRRSGEDRQNLRRGDLLQTPRDDHRPDPPAETR